MCACANCVHRGSGLFQPPAACSCSIFGSRGEAECPLASHQGIEAFAWYRQSLFVIDPGTILIYWLLCRKLSLAFISYNLEFLEV